MTIKSLMLFILLSVSGITKAQLCTPNMTPEQAFLSLKMPTQTTAQPAIPETSLTNSPTSVATLPQLININTASEAQLTQLDGIGAKKAQDIILYREMIAPFNSVDDLAKVKGIGKATVDKNRNRISVR